MQNIKNIILDLLDFGIGVWGAMRETYVNKGVEC